MRGRAREVVHGWMSAGHEEFSSMESFSEAVGGLLRTRTVSPDTDTNILREKIRNREIDGFLIFPEDMLDGGKVLRSGPLTDLSSPDVAEVEVFGDISAVASAARATGAEVVLDGDTLTIAVVGGDPFTGARDAIVAAGSSLRRLGAQRTTLEDVQAHCASSVL